MPRRGKGTQWCVTCGQDKGPKRIEQTYCIPCGRAAGKRRMKSSTPSDYRPVWYRDGGPSTKRDARIYRGK